MCLDILVEVRQRLELKLRKRRTEPTYILSSDVREHLLFIHLTCENGAGKKPDTFILMGFLVKIVRTHALLIPGFDVHMRLSYTPRPLNMIQHFNAIKIEILQ